MNKSLFTSVRLIFILFAIILSSNISYSQINIGGIPYSFINKSLNNDIPQVIMSDIDIDKLKQEDIINDKDKSKPWRFGENISVNINPDNSGNWTEIENKGRVWRVEITCKNAVSVNLTFDKYKLPKGAELFIFNKNTKETIGAFTEANNQANGKFAIAPILGSSCVLEYYEPYDVDFVGELNISTVTYGYRTAFSYEKGFGSSGSCNMNVACMDDRTWDDQIKSVCLILTASNKYCTGALINNTNEDGKPYILTAEHCYRDPSIWVFQFNWQSKTCDDPTSSPDHDDLSGAVLKAKNSDSDFCLVQMNDTPPAEYNVFYAGWDNTTNQSEKQVCIHHPNGDIKKISIDNDPAKFTDFEPLPYLEGSHIKIESWDLNTTTESGSSGSPLFNQDKKIIGQLHGGEAACGNDESDYFGAFSMSWSRGQSEAERLKDWLDPLDTGAETLIGYDPNFTPFDIDMKILSVISPKKSYYETKTIIPEISVMNRGTQTISSFTIEYSLSGSENKTFNWTGELKTKQNINIKLSELSLTYGTFSFFVKISNPNQTDDMNTSDNSFSTNVKVVRPIFYDDFETDKAWTFAGEFERGKPQGLGGSTGNTDPDTAFSGVNIIGVDLSGKGEYKGDYESYVGDKADYAISPEIDCSSYKSIGLYFRRWLGIEENYFDKAYIDVDAGNGWQNVWTNDNSLNDGSWTEQLIDISGVADGQKSVKIRFSLGETDEGQNYCGWNIDNVTLLSGVGINSLPEKETCYKLSVTNDYVILNFDKIKKNIDVNMIDITGRTIFSRKISNTNNFKINTSEYSQGIYMLLIKSDNEISTEKVFIR